MHIHMFEDASVDCDMVLVANMGENKGLPKTRPPTPLVFMFKDEPANYVMEAMNKGIGDAGRTPLLPFFIFFVCLLVFLLLLFDCLYSLFV